MSEANIEIVQTRPNAADKILIYGAGGVGKTTSVMSALVNAPPERRLVFLMTERNSLAGVDYGLTKFNIELKPGQLIYVFPEEKKKAFVDLDRAFTAYSKMSKKAAMTGNADSTEGKENYTYLTRIIKTLSAFTGTDYVTNEPVNIGNIGELTSNDILVIDGLSPIGSELWNTMVGDKLIVSMTDYMPIQRALYAIMAQLAKLYCHVIVLAHEREHTNDAGILEMVKVNTWCGNSNYDTVMGLFTDVIYCYKNGSSYKWAGAKPKVYTVARKIPQKDNLDPNFSIYPFFR